MYYKKLGTLPDNVIDELDRMIMQLHNSDIIGFQRIEFNQEITKYLNELFKNINLPVQKTKTGALVQKAFYSDPLITYPIHKDGIRCMSALNIAVNTNSDDWVRWYADEVIYNLGNVVELKGAAGTTRNTSIQDIHNVPYICEFRPTRGDVYLIDVDTFHTWHCAGPNYRTVVQTKFENFPNFEKLSSIITSANIKHILKWEE